jgi:EAL domain-containing protein (putative c-di-GMP-specific phosphodiesterase class I)/GGDEF domain-containing protein
MSLFKQIALIVVFFQIITLGAVIYQNFRSVNEQIQNRLFSDAQDTATSLGLSISMVAETAESNSRIKTMIDAIFDSGYYKAIELKNVDGDIIYEKHNPNIIYNVPQWFVKYVALEDTVANSEIMSGWSRFGVIYVHNHNGHAYTQLWDILTNLLKWFGIILVSVILVFYFLLRIVFKPLRQVQAQAEAILHHNFLKNTEEPFTTELKNVTFAMNLMVIKVKEIFKREAETLRKYRDLLYYDQEFKVPNRHYFMDLLSGNLAEKDDKAFGVIVLIKFPHINQMKNHLGYDSFFKYFQELLSQLGSIGKDYTSDATEARFSTSSYALLLPGREFYKQMDAIGIKILEAVNDISLDDEKPSFSIGMTRYNADVSLKTIMAHVDYALLQSELKIENSYHIYQEKNELEDLMLRGREMWVQAISEAIKHDRLELVSQLCINSVSKDTFHKEIFTKMHIEDGEILSANFFLPIAKYAGLLSDIDIYLFKVMRDTNESRIALNISVESIKNSDFITLIQEFSYQVALKRKKIHIHFEMNLNSIGSDAPYVAEFSKMLKRLGYSFGIDHFIFWPDSINLIETIAPSYLKVSVEHLINYAQEDGFNMIQSIHNIALTYGIDIIAVNVETQEQKELLNKIDVHLLQGCYIQEVKSL